MRILQHFEGTIICSKNCLSLKKIKNANFVGQVVFLEEDHFVAEDFLHILWLELQLLKDYHEARILSLGSYPKVFNHREASAMV